MAEKKTQIIEGTRAYKNFQPSGVKRGGDVRKFRCRCGGVSTAAPDGKGSWHYVCSVCHKVFNSTSLD